jgi:PilZ domain
MDELADRRQFWRAVFRSKVELVDRYDTVAAELIDISLKGALVKAPAQWRGAVGDGCHLKLKLAEGSAIVMRTTVAHVMGRRVGLYCESIDLDSITHLRRLVELNAGDPALLDRELATLTGV